MSKKKTVAKPSSAAQNQKTDFELSMAARNQFIVTTMNMSWQLAIVVLVPILGGYYIDQKIGGHSFFILGFVLAISGMVLVVWRQISLIEPITKQTGKGFKNVK